MDRRENSSVHFAGAIIANYTCQEKNRKFELKIKEFELKEKLMLKQLEEGNNSSDVAQALREVFGNENNK